MSAAYNTGEALPIPAKYLDYQGFWEGVDNGNLNIQKCGKCETWCHVPQPICPNCHSLERVWETVSGKGVVYSWITYNESPHPAFKAPYSVILVELEEGMRMVSNLIDVKPDEIEIGMKVDVIFEKIADEMWLPKFRKA